MYMKKKMWTLYVYTLKKQRPFTVTADCAKKWLESTKIIINSLEENLLTAR